jgi:hypothetical protein
VDRVDAETYVVLGDESEVALGPEGVVYDVVGADEHGVSEWVVRGGSEGRWIKNDEWAGEGCLGRSRKVDDDGWHWGCHQIPSVSEAW